MSEPQMGQAPKLLGNGQPAICTIWAALTPVGSSLKQEKVVQRKIRLQVLDCRSGKPIPNKPVEEVLLDGQPAVRFINAGDWDYITQFVIPANKSGPLSWAGFSSKTDSKRLQVALHALGQFTGTPLPAMTEDAWDALERYQDAWYRANKQQKPAKFKKAIENVWVQRIVAEYNQNFYRAVQVELTGLGYDCQNDNGQWGDASRKALVNWQKVEKPLGNKGPFSTFNAMAQLGDLQNLARKLQEAKKHFFTDDRGVVHIAIPVKKIEKGFKLKVSFHDFAMVLEEGLYRRTRPDQHPTQFGVEWLDGTQDKKSGSWCWRLRPMDNRDHRASLPEFRYFLEMEVPGAPSLSWRDLDQAVRYKAKFSPFSVWEPADLELSETYPEFVAFALLWCQPVFDDLQDPSAGHNINHKVYFDPALADFRVSVSGRNMHIVTLALPLKSKHSGKGYGKIEANLPVAQRHWRSNGHPGIDLYARIGDSVFALHAGKAIHNVNSDGGQNVIVTWSGKSITCLHFSKFQVDDGAWVKAGELIGLAGRTGNFSSQYDTSDPTVAPPSQYAGHTHLNIASNGYDSNLRLAIVQEDPDNAICLASNQFPLVFPCACEVTSTAWDPSHCRFADKMFTDTCWAVTELRCPYMFEAGQSPFRLQAQLRYLFENQNTQNGTEGYLNPGFIDGEIGGVPTKETPRVSATRAAIRAFVAKHQFVDSYEMDAAAWAKLDELAPVERPEN